VTSEDPAIASLFVETIEGGQRHIALPFPLPNLRFSNATRFRAEFTEESSSSGEDKSGDETQKKARRAKKSSSPSKKTLDAKKGTAERLIANDQALAGCKKSLVERAVRLSQAPTPQAQASAQPTPQPTAQAASASCPQDPFTHQPVEPSAFYFKPGGDDADAEKIRLRAKRKSFIELLAKHPAGRPHCNLPNEKGRYCALNSSLHMLRLGVRDFSFLTVEEALAFREEAARLCGFVPDSNADGLSTLRSLLELSHGPNIKSSVPIRLSARPSFHALNLPNPSAVMNAFAGTGVAVAMLLCLNGSPAHVGHFAVAAPTLSEDGAVLLWNVFDDSITNVFPTLEALESSKEYAGYSAAAILVPGTEKEGCVSLRTIYGEDDGFAQETLGENPPPRQPRKTQRAPSRLPKHEGCKEARPPNINTLRVVPEHMVNALQLSVAPIFRRLPRAPPAEAEKLIEDFLRFPALALPTVSGKTRERNKAVKKSLAGARSALLGDVTPQLPAQPSPFNSTNQEGDEKGDASTDFGTRAAIRLARLGFFSRAVRRLLQKSCDATFSQEETERQLRDLHPAGAPVDIASPSGQTFVVTPEMVLEHLRRLTGGKAPGPSGWTEELLLQVAGDNDNAIGIAFVVQQIIDGVAPNSEGLLTDAVLIGIPKPNGSIRPIAMGEVILRLAGSILIAKNLAALRRRFSGTQFGLEDGGAERIVHAVRGKIQYERHCVATLDCSNAFNTILRTAILSQLVGPFSGMLGYFRFAYGKDSRLLLKKTDGAWAHIPSSRGGKQGDTAMPALFSLGMHTAIEGLGTDEVFVYAFLDDVTIVGLPNHVVQVAREIEARLSTLGLHLNKAKCEVYGTGAESVSKLLGFVWARKGIKILGAWVTREDNGSTKEYLDKQLDKHKEMLRRLSDLTPDIAFPLLSSCGVPRWNFIARTHLPKDALEATRGFDKAIIEAFCAISDIPPENLSQDQRLLLHLPAKQGGMGITCFEKILECAYEASLNPEGDAQDARTSIINEKITEELKKKRGLSTHIDLCAGRYASSWLFATDVACKDNAGFKGALQQRIRYVPKTKKTLVHCSCGFAGKPAEIELHAAGCKGEKGNDLTARHEAVQQVLVEIAKETGVPYVLAPSCGGKKRGDVQLHLPSGAVVVDFTVCNESAPSYRAKDPGQLEAAADKRKQEHYKKGLGDRELKTFFLGTLGGWSNTAISIISELVESSTVTKQNAIRRITKEAMCRTGRMILKTRRCYSDALPQNEENKENASKHNTGKETEPSPIGMRRIFSTDASNGCQKPQNTSACRTALSDIACGSERLATPGPLSHRETPAARGVGNAADDDSDELRRMAAQAEQRPDRDEIARNLFE